jgi:hypothetical protein
VLAIRLAGTIAVTWVALTNVVVSAVEFQLTVAPETKFIPFTVRVNAGPPDETELGENPVMTGTAGLMVNVDAGDVPAVVVTVTLAVPVVAIRLAGTAAVTWVALTNVVVSAVEFHFTVAPEAKLVPFTVSVKAAPPAVAEVGARVVIVGGPGLMVKVEAGDVPRGSATVTLAVPAVAIRLAGTAAVSCVALTKVVVRAVPFQFTVAPETKLVPLIVSVKAALPAVIDAGERLPMVGPTALTVKAVVAEMPEDWATVTLAVPAFVMRLAGTAAISCVALPYVVVNAAPFHCTVAPARKPAPFTVKVNAPLPAFAEVGAMPLTLGAERTG